MPIGAFQGVSNSKPGTTVDQQNSSNELPEWQKRLLKQHKLDPAYLASAQYWFDPLVDSLAFVQEGQGRTLLVAVNGSQGSGKSTLCAYLEMAISTKYGLSVSTLSLDDFYQTRQQRLKLSEGIHPLLATRGVPGTHDMALLSETIDALLDVGPAESVPVPRFDKSSDDRSLEPERVDLPVNIVLLEGWCLGARPQSWEALVEPVNTLEEIEDPDGVWRTHINAVLERDFLPLYDRVDRWVMLQAPGFDSVYQWRLEQEHKLAQAWSAASGKRIMSDEQVERFVEFFRRITQTCLAELPDSVHHLYVLDKNRKIQSSEQRDIV
ncbi:MAG: D-glycerate 3-kinase [Halioglobus sp.]